MSLKSLLSKPLAAWAVKQQQKWSQRPLATQLNVLQTLIYRGQSTLFGRAHQFNKIRSYTDFKALVPVRDYEGLVPYINKIKAGAGNVLWPDKALYLTKTSGTTSGAKYLPITKESMPHHVEGARNALFNYIHKTGRATFLARKMIFLSGSPRLSHVGSIPTGRLSGIVNHHVPSYLQRNQLPSYKTNCIEDWEKKVEAIVEETVGASMGLISGIPPWIQMYFDKLQQRTSQLIKELFPDLSLLVHGGVNFAPYRAKLLDSLGGPIDMIETYPASEGFIAFQDSQEAEGLLLQLNSGMFFEFIPVQEYFKDNPRRLWLEEVELGVDYALILSTNAGLWAYALGDTVKFVSKDPYRIIVTGRVKHFISAFGEHVIAEEVDKAMQHTLAKHPEAVLSEFTVAPKVSQEPDTPSCHEWLVEFSRPPKNISTFAQELDHEMRYFNTYYNDLVAGKVLQPLRLTSLPQGTFTQHMQRTGKLGGQNKLVRLANDRTLAEALLAHKA